MTLIAPAVLSLAEENRGFFIVTTAALFRDRIRKSTTHPQWWCASWTPDRRLDFETNQMLLPVVGIVERQWGNAAEALPTFGACSSPFSKFHRMILRKCHTHAQFVGLLNDDQSALQPSLVQSFSHSERWTGFQNGDHCSLIDNTPWMAGTTWKPKHDSLPHLQMLFSSSRRFWCPFYRV